MNTRLLILAMALLSMCAGTPCLADYYLVPTVERFVVIPDHWKIDKSVDGKSNPTLEITYSKKTYKFPLDYMRIADVINSDSICTGKFRQVCDGYVEKIKPDEPVVVDVRSIGKGMPLFASMITPTTRMTDSRTRQYFASDLDTIKRNNAEQFRKIEKR